MPQAPPSGSYYSTGYAGAGYYDSGTYDNTYGSSGMGAYYGASGYDNPVLEKA